MIRLLKWGPDTVGKIYKGSKEIKTLYIGNWKVFGSDKPILTIVGNDVHVACVRKIAPLCINNNGTITITPR